MKFSNIISPNVRKWARLLHRDISFLFSGMIIIYAISGLVMNHRDTINPNYSIERKEVKLTDQLPADKLQKKQVLDLMSSLKIDEKYVKHYSPAEGEVKVFLKGGSNLYINLTSQQLVYEKITHRPILSSFARLHYNPGRWWTYFADAFAIALLLITITGIVMLKGRNGLWGKGGIYFIIGILIPILFLVL